MQDVDGVSHIHTLPEPFGARRPRADAKALCVVIHTERLDRISGHRGGRRHLRERMPVRPPESKSPVGPTLDLETLLVHRAMMPATEQREIRERRRASVRPVAKMMPLAIAHAAARETATPVPMVERAPQGRGNRAGPGPDFHHPTIFVVAHHHPARVARQAPGRFL
jgi:hypothetical protein